MFFPYADLPNPPGFRAWVTWLLLAANIAVYVFLTLPYSATPVDPNDPALHAYFDALTGRLPPDVDFRQFVTMMTGWDLFVFEYGYKSGAPSVRDLFASMFLHGGLLHLGGNMLFLWIYGDNVEHRLGRLGYLVTYLGTGVVATWSFAWLSGPSMVPMVGASGAISGLLGLYFFMFPRNVIKVFVFLFPFWMTTWMVPARLVLGLFVVVDNLFPMLLGAGGGVAYGAHLGGFIAGLGVAWLGERLDWRGPWVDRLGGAAPPEGGVDALRGALDRGDRREAIEAMRGLSSRELASLEVPDILRVGAQLQRSGHPIAAFRWYRSALARTPADQRAPLHLALGELLLSLGEGPSAYQHLVAARAHADTRALAEERLLGLGIDLRGRR